MLTGKFCGLANYRLIMGNEAFGAALKNTARFTLVCIPLLVTGGLLTALLLRKIRSAGLFKAVFLFPLAIPAAAAAAVWQMVFAEPSLFSLVVCYLWKNTGYTVILWLAGLASLPENAIEAARVDGAGPLQLFRHIIRPELRGSIYTIVVLSVLNSFKIYREAYLVAGSYPPKNMYLLQHLFHNWFMNLEFDKMAAATVCTGVILFVLILVLQKLWDRDYEDMGN